MLKNGILKFLLIGIVLTVFAACQKKGNFVNEGKLGVGVHYYPFILNTTYYDTITHKYFKDTSFSRGQAICFQLKYKSQNPISQIQLWMATDKKKAKEVWHTTFDSSFYSELQNCDTTIISLTLPNNIDTSTQILTLYPKVVTEQGLVTKDNFSLQLAK